MSDNWAINAFDNELFQLDVHGPNGFYRMFKGDTNHPNIKIRCTYEKSRDEKSFTGGLLFTCINQDSKGHRLLLEDISYGQGKKKSTSKVVSQQQFSLIFPNKVFGMISVSAAKIAIHSKSSMQAV
ncbi:DUF756 domain-containing protein [Sphingobacterium sp. E70]|uniref:phospholipase domain-containing protein n=1 Tax=Sphingobacterium sp. E70 TaxID=2853439 RepID=UPI00211D0CD5|nr:phospholipase domain-containing protein [Sphingobacterium sp. E70]ULT27504.1 DUF756 domain-containing protein [Sphingobacterium sp. E70]